VLAGALAALLFAIVHVADGVAQAGQRDFVMAVLLLGGYVPLFAAVRRSSASLLFIFGLCCGAAATIKPQAVLLGLVLTLAAACICRRRSKSLPKLLAWGWTGLAAPVAFAFLWLYRMHAVAAFLHLSDSLIMYHAQMARHPLGFLLAHAVPSQLLPLAILALIIMFLNRGWRKWQQLFVLTGIAFGVLSFCVQGKAYPYHRYPLIGFLLLFVAIEIAGALASPAIGERTSKWQKGMAWSIVAYIVLWLAPVSAARALRYDWWSQPSLDQLQLDLQRAGNSRFGNKSLDRQVQCMDTMAGCITVLDRMQILQSTGFLYDCYFFAPGPSPVKEEQRYRFLLQIRRQPPKIFVITDQWCLNLHGGYAKLQEWPEFADFLDANYALTEERSPGPWDHRRLATWPFGYRLYVRK
jgi:hypothetical protein